jgi:hypothetical protein
LGSRVQLPVAIAASLALPLLTAAIARCFWPGIQKVDDQNQNTSAVRPDASDPKR